MSIKTDKYTNYNFHVFGCRGSMPVTGSKYIEFGGETSCYILKKGEYAIIIDCGSGLYNTRDVLAQCKRIDIIMTHMHYDHTIGLLGWAVFPKGADINFYGRFDKWMGDKTFDEFFQAPFWPIQPSLGVYHQIPEFGTPLVLKEDIKVVFYEATHPNFSSVCTIEIDEKKIVVMFDTESPGDIPLEEMNDCDLLLYDGMYTDENYHIHRGWGHSTWQEGVNLAQKVKPHKLIITHHDPMSSDYDLKMYEKEAQEKYKATRFARVKDIYQL